MGIGAALCLGLLLRLDGLARRELWYDEVCTHYVVHHLSDWPADGPDLRREVAHRPYFFLLRAWTRLVGEDAWGLRTFSVLAGCVGIWALAGTAGRIGGRSVALIAAVLAAVHPLHIYYSQEARVYTPWALEAVLCLFALHRAAISSRRRWWIAYALLAWITVATHYYTMLWLPATVGAVFVTSNKKRFLKQWFMTHALLVLALVPVVVIFVMPLRGAGPKLWLEETWASYPPLLAIPRSLWAMLPAGGYPDYLGTLPVAFRAFPAIGGGIVAALARWGPGLLVMVLLAVASVRARRSVVPPWATSAVEHHTEIRRPPRGAAATMGGPLSRGTTRKNTCDPTPGGVDIPATLLFLLTTTLAFLGAAWLYSFVVAPAYVVGRYDFFAWPAVTISVALLVEAAARGVGSPRRAGLAVRIVVTGMLVLCSGATVAGTRSVAATNQTAQRAERLAARIDAGDLVVSLGMYRWFLSYEWLRQGLAPEIVSFPRRHGRQLCWADARAELADRKELVEDVAFVVTKVRLALSQNRRVWLLAHGEPDGLRWEVDTMLYERLQQSGFEIQPEDEWLGLARLVAKRPTGAVPVDRGD